MICQLLDSELQIAVKHTWTPSGLMAMKLKYVSHISSLQQIERLTSAQKTS